MSESGLTSRASNRRLRQIILWCRCGSPKLASRGLCATCYAREQHDRRCYGGHRAAVVSRDGRFCRACAQPCLAPASLVVHHRRPGVSRLPLLVSLCRGCHARVHRLRAIRRAVCPEVFLSIPGRPSSWPSPSSLAPAGPNRSRSLRAPVPMPDTLARLPGPSEARDLLEVKLIGMVLDGVTSLHSRRAYEKGLRLFFAWCREQSRDQPRAFSKALANAYRSWLLAQSLAPSTINLRLSPVRKLAREMADNHLLAPDTAAAIERVPGVKQEGVRSGNWLLKEQASELLNAPNPRPSKANAIAPCSRCWSAAACAAPSCSRSRSTRSSSAKAAGSSRTWLEKAIAGAPSPCRRRSKSASKSGSSPQSST